MIDARNGSRSCAVEHCVMTSDTEPGRAGDRTWIAELYEREWPSLMRVAYLLTSSRPTAEEIVQDAFVRLQATRTTVLNPAAYLRTVVVNACRDVHRHQAVVARNPPPAPEPAIAEHDELFDALSRLPWRQQAALVQSARDRTTENIERLFRVPLHAAGKAGVKVIVTFAN